MLLSIASLRSKYCKRYPSIANYIGGDPWYNVSVKNDTQYFSDFDYYASKLTSGIDFRAKNYDALENVEKNSIDFYASVKSLYLQDDNKKFLIQTRSLKPKMTAWEEIETE